MVREPVSFRSDIQGLRAVAILAVLACHLWPTAVTGGFVGIDVFFVISGFLLADRLVRELERTGTLELGACYARRLRRVVPAASATLLAVATAAAAWTPPSQWPDLARELVASALQVENLLLVDLIRDLAPGAASPVQHFWALSVGAQFHVVWPLVVLVTAAAAAADGFGQRRALWIVSLLVMLASLGWGIHLATSDAAAAYFATTTRVWELGLGALLAFGSAPGPARLATRRIAGWSGLAAIIASAAWFTDRTPYPGYAALLPAIGAAAILVSRPAPDGLLGRLLGARPLQYVGGLSFSLYLWHWPVVMFYDAVLGHAMTSLQDGILAAVVSFALAHASKGFIEDRFREPVPGERLRPWALGAALTAGVVMAAGVASWHGARLRPHEQTVVSGLPDHPGAAAWRTDGAPHAPRPFIPEAGEAVTDLGPGVGNGIDRPGCEASVRSRALEFCDFGDTDAPVHVVVVGDAQATHWMPALERIAEEKRWRITGLAKGSCPFADTMVRFVPRGATEDEAREYTQCRIWGTSAAEWILGEKPDLVLVSHHSRHAVLGMDVPGSQRAVAEGVVGFARRLIASGIPVAVLRHTPWQSADPVRCLTRSGGDVDACSTITADVAEDGSLLLAARIEPDIAVIDMTPYLCREARCPLVIGNVLVYRDRTHLTATYSRTLAPMLAERLVPLLERRPRSSR